MSCSGSFSAPATHVFSVKRELDDHGKDITLLVEGGLKTKEGIGEHCHSHVRGSYLQ